MRKLTNSKPTQLNYVFGNPPTKIPLNLYEAERYENAVIVQQLIGNLVVYSNKGRYEPSVAKSWERQADGTWNFELHSHFKCENGEIITASGFKKSIETSIRYLSRESEVTIFSKLKGYKAFVSGKSSEIEGIKASNDKLGFEFESPVRSGLIQVLSFAPFGYICSENRKENGEWKDDSVFISSGPYKITEHNPGVSHTIKRRSGWPVWNKDAPEIVHFTYSLVGLNEENQATVYDSFLVPKEIPSYLKRYKLVPEYLSPIVLRPSALNRFFANKDNRVSLRNALQLEKKSLPEEFDNHSKAEYFYQTQPPKNLSASNISTVKAPEHPLIIQGNEPKPGERKYVPWTLLKQALKNLNWQFEFDNKPPSFAALNTKSADIQLQAWSVGGGAEAWVIDSIFYSDLGPHFPDPSGEIKSALKRYDEGVLSDQDFVDSFNQSVFEDAAILPVSHFGVMMYFSDHIDLTTISPLICIMRFNQIGLD